MWLPATLTPNKGFILAGFNNNGSSIFNFAIDRTDKGGAFTAAPFVFKKEYQIYADVTNACNPMGQVQLTTCHGVSVIETLAPGSNAQAAYAVAAAFDEGCMVAFLDVNGSQIPSNAFYFRFPSTNAVTKPMIIEDPNNPGEYFVCGGYNSTMYVFHVDVNGTTTFNYTYPISGEPKAITLTPAGDLVIVGRTNTYGTDDGFFITLNSSGTITVFETYDYNSLSQEFLSVSPDANTPTGFIIGGTCETSSGFFMAYNIKVKPTGVKFFDNVITFNSDLTAANIVGIVQRNSSIYNYEYFGVLTSTAGIILARMDNSGVPTWAGSGTRHDDTPFNAPGVALQANGVSFFDGTGYDEGLHIYGTDLNNSPPAHYLAKAYFSGHDGCTVPSVHNSTWNNICTNTSKSISPGSGLAFCNALHLVENTYGKYVASCGPYSSVLQGSNNKVAITGIKSEIDGGSFSIAPNPAKDFVKINCQNLHEINSVVIRDALGREVFNSPIDKFSRSENEVQLDLSSLSLVNGFYTVSLTTPTGIVSRKIVIQN